MVVVWVEDPWNIRIKVSFNIYILKIKDRYSQHHILIFKGNMHMNLVKASKKQI
jgi:hypothetical protein